MTDPKSSLPVTGTMNQVDSGGDELNINADGSINTVVSGTVSITPAQVTDLKNVAVTNFPATQAVTGPLTDTQLRATPVPVSGTVTANVAGVSTSALQTAGNASLSSIDSKLTSPLSIENLTFASDKVDASGSSVSVSNFPAQQAVIGPLTNMELRASAVPVSMAAIPLPTGAATEAKQDDGNNYLASIDNKLTAPFLVTGALTDTQLRATPVPVSGTVAVSNFPATQPISAAALPLPTGASTSALQTSGNSILTSINSFASSIDGKLTAPISVTGALTDAQLRASAVPVSGTVTANLGTIAGVATSANQVTAQATLTSIDNKLASPLTVQATDLDIRDLAYATDSVDVSGSKVSLDNTTITTLKNVTVVNAAGAAAVNIQDGGNSITVDGSVSVSNFPATQPISAAALPLPTGASTDTLQTAGNSNLSSIDSKLTDVATLTEQLVQSNTLSNIENSVSNLETPIKRTIQDVGVGNGAADKNYLVGGIYKISPPALTDKDQSELILDEYGSLRVTGTVDIAAGSEIALNAATLTALEDVTVQNGAGAAAVNIQDGGNSITVDGPATNAELRATPLPVSITGSIATGGLTDAELRASAVPVSLTSTTITSSALPTGASTAALQTSGNASLSSLDTKIPTLSTSSGNLNVNVASGSIVISSEVEIKNDSGNPVPVSGTVAVSNFPATQAISAVALPLPSGAATSALQTAGNASLSSIDSKLTSPLAITGALTDAQLRASAVPISAAALPLPSGAATSALQTTGNTSISSIVTNQTNGTQKSIVRGGAKGATVAGDVTSTNVDANTQALDVSIKGTPSVSVSNASIAVTGTFFQATQPISATALPLPTGASTDTLQTSGNASLSSINTKTPALGQALAAASVPVVLTAAQLATLTPLSSVSVSNFPATQPISGTVSISGTPNVAVTSSALPTGAATAALQTSGNASLSSIDSKLTSPLAVTGTFFQATQPISAVALPLPSGAATAALQTSGNATLTNINGLQTTANASLSSIDSKLTSPLSVTDSVNVSAVYDAISATATPTIAKVGASNLANRKSIIFTPTSGNIYFGFTSGLTTSNGMIVFKNQTVELTLGPSIDLYIIRSGGSNEDVRIVEMA